MRQTERYQAVRDLWLTLVRAACLTQVGGYRGAVNVSRRFTIDVTAFEVGQFGRTAQRVVQEYGLFSEMTQEGNSLSIRITREEAPTGQKVKAAGNDGVSALQAEQPRGPEHIEQPSSSSLAKLLHFRRAARTAVQQ